MRLYRLPSTAANPPIALGTSGRSPRSPSPGARRLGPIAWGPLPGARCLDRAKPKLAALVLRAGPTRRLARRGCQFCLPIGKIPRFIRWMNRTGPIHAAKIFCIICWSKKVEIDISHVLPRRVRCELGVRAGHPSFWVYSAVKQQS